ncbi:MAG: hypothetical protein ACYC38_13140 [Eubacteriales bacterium]
MKFKIRINPVAIADVQEIKAYIAEDNPAVFIAKITLTIQEQSLLFFI